MSWKQSDLIANLSTKYFAVDTSGTVKQSQDSKGITWMTINVFEVGLSQQSKVPTGYRKNVDYYVYNLGQSATEQAWYSQVEPVNTSNTDVTLSTSSYDNIANLYNSIVLQNRVLTAIITQSQSVFLESSATSNHVNRLKLVNLSNTNLHLVVMEFMSAIALDTTVQSQGTSVADSYVQSVVTNSWNSFANLIVS